MDAPDRLTRLPSWLLAQSAQLGARHVAEALGAAGVRRHHFAVLTALAEDGARSQAALSERLWIDRSDLVAVLDDLGRDGLVERTRDPEDRRRNLLRLTTEGATVLRDLDARVEAAQDALLAPLSDADRRKLVALLTRVVGR